MPFKKRFLWWMLGVVAVGLSTRYVACQGWIRPIRVAGGSMANSLVGRHFPVTCDDCGIGFCCGVEFPPVDDLAVCPNCGYCENSIEQVPPVRGQRILIDRWDHWWRGPRLWQAVAFRSPSDTQRLEVKRVVAAGGGIVEIRYGNVYVDGVVQRKTLEQLRELRILVHDDRFRPSNDPSLPRWRPADPASNWRQTEFGYVFDGGRDAGHKQLDWIGYQQWTCWPNPSPPVDRQQTTQILDHYGYNQSVARGPLHLVSDIMLACRVDAVGSGPIVFRLKRGAEVFDVELNSLRGTHRLLRNDAAVLDRRHHAGRPPWDVEIALCDEQILAAINGVTIIRHVLRSQPRDEPGGSPEPCHPFLSIGAAGCQAKLSALQVFRDVHYLGPGAADRWTSARPLAPDQWFVLGDNVPISFDSRQGTRIAPHAILGPVKKRGTSPLKRK